jgi:predicted nicotinamide N-methyase
MVKAEYESLRQRGLQPAFPYWTRLWPSAIALAGFLADYPEYIRGKVVLEWAAGLGLPSLVAAREARWVRCTDLSADAMALAARSAQMLGITNMEFHTADWNDPEHAGHAEVVLLSDVNYEPAAFSALLQLVRHYWNEGACLVLTTPQRLMAKPFIEALLPYAVRQETRRVEDTEGSHAITLLVMQHGQT